LQPAGVSEWSDMQENNIEIVTAFNEKLAAQGQIEADDAILSGDFKLIAGSVEIDRQSFIEIINRLYRAIPDLKHTLSNIQLRGDVVQLTIQSTGLFTETWDGSSLGLPVIPPSGGPVHMGPTKWEITVRDGKITRWHDITLPSRESGLPGFIKALGAQLPTKQKRAG
jgi:predicted ester cyclase